MQTIFTLLRRHWRKLLVIAAVLLGGIAYASNSRVRTKAHSAWHAALVWAGLDESSADFSKMFWCPMDPQIKSHKENAVCPICNMALIELESGIVAAPEHLTLTAQQIQQAGVATSPVMRRTLFRSVDTTGRVDYDERELAKITSWIRGKSRIEKLHVSFMGQTVEKGEPLAELYSPELIVAQQEYLSALEASSRLSASSLDDGLMRSAGQKLKHQGLTPQQIDRLATKREVQDRIRIMAQNSGTVTKRHVQEGQYVSEGDVLFEIANLSTLWVFADIYEDEMPLVEVGTPVTLSVSNLPGQSFSGNVTFINPMVRPATRTVPVRIDVDNQNGKLLPGMFARVTIRHLFPAVLAVPDQAVLWSGQRSVVIVKVGEGAFRPSEIRTGQKWLYDDAAQDTVGIGFGEGRIRFHEVLSGLSPGDVVVTSGAFLLNSESQFQSVLTKMLPPDSEQVTLEQVVGEPIATALRQVLNAYFQLSATLAEDKIEEVDRRLGSLSAAVTSLVATARTEGNSQLAVDAQKYERLVSELASGPVQNAGDARTRFGRISHDLTKLLAAHGGKTLFGDELFQFECGMAKVGYERWLWWSPEIHNPYMGQKMLKCGTKLDVLEP